MADTTNLKRITYKQAIAAGQKDVIERSEWCICWCCFVRFYPDEITEWCDEGTCAICPSCGIDTVLGSEVAGKCNVHTLKELNKQMFSADGVVFDDATDERLAEGRLRWLTGRRKKGA